VSDDDLKPGPKRRTGGRVIAARIDRITHGASTKRMGRRASVSFYLKRRCKQMKTVSETADRPLLSVTQAANLAGLSITVAYRLAKADALPGLVRLPGARLLVRRRVLEAWLSGDDEVDPVSTERGTIDRVIR